MELFNRANKAFAWKWDRPRARVTSAYFGTSGTNPVGKFARNCPCFLIITYFWQLYLDIQIVLKWGYKAFLACIRVLWLVMGLLDWETWASHDREYKSGWHGVDMAACGGPGKMILLQLVINLVLKRNQQNVAFLGECFLFFTNAVKRNFSGCLCFFVHLKVFPSFVLYRGFGLNLFWSCTTLTTRSLLSVLCK